MKRKLLFILLFMSMLPLTGNAASQKIDDIYYNLNSTTQTAEVAYRLRYKYNGDLVIPSSVTYEEVEYSVTGISSNAFKGSTELTSVTIPSSVTSIGGGIFDGCTSLASIVIAEGNPKYDSRENCNAIIETASNTLFSGCKSSIVPSSVTTIGKSAFVGCTALTAFNIPNHVTTIGESAFAGCSGLTAVTIGSGVTTIGREAFKECSNLTKVVINNNAIVSKDNHTGSPTPISNYFGMQVEEYVLGEEVTSIGYDAFFNCNSLISVQMSNSITNIGEGAFKDCRNLTSVKMSDNLTSIGQFAFNNCFSLAAITIPSGVTNIDWVFDGCSRLTKVVINSNAIVSKAYYSHFSLSRYFGYQVQEYVLGEEVTSIGDYAFCGCTSLTAFIIPDNVTSIGESAFAGCYGLTAVSIPKNVTSIGDNAFQNCGLTTIQVESGNTVYDSREDCNAIIKTAENTLLLGCQNTVIPNSITAIGDNAFYCCEGLTSVSIPDGVTSIGYSAFCGCTDLTSINIPNSVTNIGQYALASCKGLTAISIPNGVTTIGDYAFFGCSGLSTVTIPSSVATIGSRVFNNCSGLTAIQVESGNMVYDSREDCNAVIETASNTIISGCQNTIIPHSVVTIGECAFWGCPGMTSMAIPNSVTSIGRCAFTECADLATVTIPNSVTSIEYCAFSSCMSLATVIIGNALTDIGEGAFFSCYRLKDMYLYAEQVPALGNNVFDNSHYNATLHVPAGSLEAYNTAKQWMDFGIIVALTDSDPTPTGIQGIGLDAMTGERYYSLDGKYTTTPQQGLNIVRMSNGTTRKVVIK